MHRLLTSLAVRRAWQRPGVTSADLTSVGAKRTSDARLAGGLGQFSQRHYFNRQKGPVIREMNRRTERVRLDETLRQGKVQITRRSDFIEWNYASELSAFSARIGETFDDAKLREAFLDKSYAEVEQRRQLSLGLEEVTTMTTNVRLAEVGLKLTRDVLTKYIRAAFPYLPEEGVTAYVEHLTSLDVVANTSFHLGTRDLVMSEEYPPLRESYRRTFLALVGALSESPAGSARAGRFVVDILAAQLHAKDVNELWEIADPMKTLAKVLANDGRRSVPETRLLWVSGKDTILACYHVGVYCDKELIGQSPGETAEIAEDMAARDALRRLFRTDDARTPMPLGQELDQLELKSQPNPTLSQWSEMTVGNLVRLGDC